MGWYTFLKALNNKICFEEKKEGRRKRRRERRETETKKGESKEESLFLKKGVASFKELSGLKLSMALIFSPKS